MFAPPSRFGFLDANLHGDGGVPSISNLPKYWKDKETGGRKLLLVVRQDRYVVDEKNHIILKDFGLEIIFTGRLRWYGKQGRLEIYYDG